MPDLSWLDRQSSLTIVNRNAHRTVYRVNGNGGRIFHDFQRDLRRQGWEISNLQTNGQWYGLHATRGRDAIDATLQDGAPGTFTVVSANSGHRPNPPGGEERSVDSNRIRQDYTCNGNAFALNGDSCRITVHGDCSEVRIRGSHNQLYIDASTPLVIVSGNDNLVRWRGSRNGRRPTIRNSGHANDIGSY